VHSLASVGPGVNFINRHESGADWPPLYLNAAVKGECGALVALPAPRKGSPSRRGQPLVSRGGPSDQQFISLVSVPMVIEPWNGAVDEMVQVPLRP